MTLQPINEKEQPKPQRASRHHGGAASGAMGAKFQLPATQILSRYPTQNRPDQARQQLSQGSALRASRHHGGAASDVKGTAWEVEERKKSGRFPTRFRMIQRGSNWVKAQPWRNGNKALIASHPDFESLPDSKSPRSSAAATESRLSLAGVEGGEVRGEELGLYVLLEGR